MLLAWFVLPLRPDNNLPDLLHGVLDGVGQEVVVGVDLLRDESVLLEVGVDDLPGVFLGDVRLVLWFGLVFGGYVFVDVEVLVEVEVVVVEVVDVL